MRKTITCTILIICIAAAAWAQQTIRPAESAALLERGKELYAEGLYLQAKDRLTTYLRQQDGSDRQDILQAELLIAQSALRADLPEGEKLLLAFINEYRPEREAQQATLDLANYYASRKMYEQALLYYDQVDPEALNIEQLSDMQFRRGYAYFVRQDAANAKAAFGSVTDPNDKYYHEANYYLGILAFEEGNYQQALKAFDNANQKGQYDAVTPYYKCQIHFAEKEYPQVAQVGEAALASKKAIEYENEVKQLVGKAYFEQGMFAKALPYFEEYSKNADKLRAQDLYQVAYTRYRNGKYEAAIKDFEELKASDDEMGQNALYNLGDSYLKKNDKFSARNAFHGASKMDYNKEIAKEANFQYGRLSYDLGFDREALTAFEAIPRSDKNHAEAQRLMSRIFLNTRDFDKAISLLESIPNKSPDLKEAYQKVTYRKAIELYNDGKMAESKRYLNLSLKDAVDSYTKAQALFRLGEIAHKEKDYEGSIRYMDQHLALAKAVGSLPAESETYMANYTQGYNYLKQKKYEQSSTYFVDAVNAILDKWDGIYNEDIKNRVLPDALLRAGDTNFKLNRYKVASSYYQTSVKYKYEGYDYAMFQQARIQGVQGKPVEQITTLKELTGKLPNSPYADDGLYLLGNTYFRERNFDAAERTIKKLVTDYKSTSNLTNKGYLLLGLINYNQNDKATALAYYEQVFSNNPTQEEMNSALRSIEEIYIDNNDPDGFIAFQERVLGQKVSDVAKDSLVFKAAEMQYEANNFPKAVEGYSKYIKKFPNGRYLLQAHYNRGESNIAQNLYVNALPDYEYVISRGNSGLYERALTKAASISYNAAQDFEKAYKYYSLLATVATDEDKRFDAHLGALRSAYRLSFADGVFVAADNVIKNSKATRSQKATAHFYKGKMALGKGDYNTALASFRESAKEANIEGAESRYQIAYIYYVKRELSTARELCMTHLRMSKNYESWVARGLVLLSDISYEQGDLFNARAALETLIENYDNPDDAEIIATAKEKLASIAREEGKDSRIVPE